MSLVCKDEKKEKRIKHYSSSHKILLVGEGDFSFALCLAKAFGSAKNMVATSFEPKGKLLLKYSKVGKNLEKLEELGCKILHKVNAHSMSKHRFLSIERFDRIIFNFPHAGFYREEDSDLQIQLHKELVKGFFASARCMLTDIGEIHVTHKAAHPYSTWGIKKLAKQARLVNLKEHKFSRSDYPGYRNKRGDGNRSDESFSVGECYTFTFSRKCPIYLKEAISTVEFAAPRCVAIPELVDIRKHFTARYGKEFASAAVELRPECGVGRMSIEKLSIKAPDVLTKMKILREIAEEHNIKWEPESSEETETKPREDLLNGPNSFEAAGRMHVKSPYIQVLSHHVDKHSTKPQETHKQDGRHDDNVKFSDCNSRPSTQSSQCTGAGSKGMESRQPFRSGSSVNNLNWSMQFSDAASAAQAAADSAERAGMATRAAVELSSCERPTMRHSTESRESTASESKTEVCQNHATIKLQGKSTRDQCEDTVSEQTDKNDRDEDLKKLMERFNQLMTMMTASDDTFSSTSSINLLDRPCQTESVKNEFSDETNVDLSGKDRMEYKEASIRKQLSNVFSDSHSSSFSDDGNVVSSFNKKKVVNQSTSDPFFSYGADNNRDTKETTSKEKWIMHYSSSHKILLVGEGDFSFALCLAKAFGYAKNMVATSFEPKGKLLLKYSKVGNNLEKLEELGCKILHKVNAHNMSKHRFLSTERFDRIIFNFPHAGFDRKKSSDEQIELHKKLVMGFFASARCMLTDFGEIHVTHKAAHPYSTWGIKELAKKARLVSLKEHKFSKCDYPGYRNKRGDGSDESFSVGECYTFTFIKYVSCLKL